MERIIASNRNAAKHVQGMPAIAEQRRDLIHAPTIGTTANGTFGRPIADPAEAHAIEAFAQSA
ncbi:hypothetical protein [Sphingomonas sp. PvP056]|uniref:hypothetical protein n=1 Tax=Sphingomonas sp. PvP056 TaxID=3156392 RepID=UPI003393A936